MTALVDDAIPATRVSRTNVWLARFRSFFGVLATVAWCSLALILRPFWSRSVIVLQPYWARTVLLLLGVKVDVNSETIIHPPVIYVANHQSSLDILVLIGCMPDSVRFVAKKEMAKVPFTGWCMRAADYVFIDRSKSGEARKSLGIAGVDIQKGGRSVVIFPEGTRYLPGYLGPFKSGAIHLAVAAEAVLVPVGITHTGELMERHSLVSRPGHVDINMGEPIDPRVWKGSERELVDHIRAQVRRLAGASGALDVSPEKN